MALIRSTMLSSISGSIAGATYARNRSGAYVRNRTVPVNPNSDNQITARTGLTNVAQQWRSLSDGTQAAWKQYADNTPTTNRLGEVIHLSGINQYVRLNAFLAFLSKPPHTAAPLAFGTANAITGVTFSLDSATDTLTITNVAGSDVSASAVYGIWISLPIGPGITFYKGPWQFVASAIGTDLNADPLDIVLPFNVGLGQYFRLRLRNHDANFRMGNEYISPLAEAA